MATRKYGVNVVSLYPWCLGPNARERTIKLAYRAGFNGIQALPLRGWDLANVKKWERWVISYEDAWNFGPLWKMPLRHLGILPTAPTWWDALFFQRANSPVMKALPSMHHWGEGILTEIHPELGTDHRLYIEKATQGQMMVWDTYHVQRPLRSGGPGIQDWPRLLGAVCDAIKLIHVHPVGDEEGSLLAGTGEIASMLKMLKKYVNPEVPVILEITPRITTPTKTRMRLTKLLRATQQFFEIILS